MNATKIWFLGNCSSKVFGKMPTIPLNTPVTKILIMGQTNFQRHMSSNIPQQFNFQHYTEKSPMNRLGIFSAAHIHSISSDKLQSINASRPQMMNKRFMDNIASMPLKKRPTRKKRLEEYDKIKEGHYNVIALATAEEYDLEGLLSGLVKQDLYQPKKFFSTDSSGMEQDVLYVTAKYQVEQEPRDIFFFREGSVVLWNCSDLEISNVLSFLRHFESDGYDNTLVNDESESMPYCYVNDINSIAHFKNDTFYLTHDEENYLEKYTFANALSTSVKLGIWEASLDRYIESMAYVTEDLKHGSRLKMTRGEVLRKTGELFALRHLINLSSDLLDTPDFYWDRKQLEDLYNQTCGYFSIQRRTRVMNEKLTHCVELADLVSSNLNDTHHVRLEWMIIILIMVEVGFEILHFIDRYYEKQQETAIKKHKIPSMVH